MLYRTGLLFGVKCGGSCHSQIGCSVLAVACSDCDCHYLSEIHRRNFGSRSHKLYPFVSCCSVATVHVTVLHCQHVTARCCTVSTSQHIAALSACNSTLLHCQHNITARCCTVSTVSQQVAALSAHRHSTLLHTKQSCCSSNCWLFGCAAATAAAAT
jgi:hypothetical protein